MAFERRGEKQSEVDRISVNTPSFVFGNTISPRSSNCDRLEGSLRPSRTSKKFVEKVCMEEVRHHRWRPHCPGLCLGSQADNHCHGRQKHSRDLWSMDIPGKSVLFTFRCFVSWIALQNLHQMSNTMNRLYTARSFYGTHGYPPDTFRNRP